MAFKKSELKFDEHGVPFLKFARIEEIATELLENYCSHVLVKGCPTPVMDILEKLQERTKLKYVSIDLGSVDGKKVLGKVNFPSRTLFLDASLLQDRKIQLRFTAAHEIGHWVLHRHHPLKFDKAKAIAEITDDDDALQRLESVTPRDWIERQANAFAAALVLPAVTFHSELVRAQHEVGIVKNLGVVFVGQARNTDYAKILAILSSRYGVSKQSVEVRLKTLNFLIGEGSKSVKSAADVLRGGKK